MISSSSFATHKPLQLQSEFQPYSAKTLYKSVSSSRKISHGNIKTRVLIEGMDDRSGVFAKAVSSKSRNNDHAPIIRNPFTNRRFVLLRVQEPGEDPIWVLANIGSLSKRLGIDKKEIRESFKAGTLEETIKAKIDEMNKPASSSATEGKKKKKGKKVAEGTEAGEAPKIKKKKAAKVEGAGGEEAPRVRKRKGKAAVSEGKVKKGSPGAKREALRRKLKKERKEKAGEGERAKDVKLERKAKPKRKAPPPPDTHAKEKSKSSSE